MQPVLAVSLEFPVEGHPSPTFLRGFRGFPELVLNFSGGRVVVLVEGR